MRTPWWVWTTVAGAIIGAALGLSPQAQATPDQDAVLYDTMASAGVWLYPQAVPAAYEVCAAVWGGVDPYSVALDVAAGNPSWPWDRAKLFVGTAIQVYCPPDSGVREKRIYA